MKQRNKMRIHDMTHNYWLYFEENYVQKGFRKTRKIIDGKTSNDGDASTHSIEHILMKLNQTTN